MKSDLNGFAHIAELYQHAVEADGNTIDLDWGEVEWFDANLSAALAAVAITVREERKKTVRSRNLQPRVADILGCHGLFAGSKKRRRSTVVPLQQFRPGDARKFAAYTQSHLADKGLPTMSAQVTRRVFQGIDELFQNAEIHSRTKHGMLACGQLFPKANRLDFSLVDMGIGFQEVISVARHLDMGPAAAIHWAMQRRNTTRSLDVPGGLGLKILKEFIRQNGGRLLVVSHRGYWSFGRGGVSQRVLPSTFPGTMVTIEVNTADRSEYLMRHEINPSAIF